MDKTNQLIIRKAKSQDSDLLSKIILRNALDELPIDIHDFFIDLQSPEKICERLNNNYVFYIGYLGKAATSVLGIKSDSHLSHLFVDKNYRQRGIAKRLWQHYSSVRPKDLDNNEMTVMSSHFAVGMYKKFGFLQTGDAAVTNGIPHVPMLYRFNQKDNTQSSTLLSLF